MSSKESAQCRGTGHAMTDDDKMGIVWYDNTIASIREDTLLREVEQAARAYLFLHNGVDAEDGDHALWVLFGKLDAFRKAKT
jgi:hypothetical protein